jgi:anti-sigma B factor antagonist
MQNHGVEGAYDGPKRPSLSARVVRNGFAVVRGGSRDGRVCIAVTGELDLSHADELRQSLERELRDGQRLLLDLSGVTFIDSTGLSAIVNAVAQSRGSGGGLEVSSDLQPQARRLMELTGVLNAVTLVDDRLGDVEGMSLS